MTYSQVLAYDPASPSGLRWIVDQPTVGKTAGDVAGGKRPSGYWAVGVFGKRVQAHVIVWELHNGPVPDGMDVEHIDRDRANCKLSNLRLATRTQNMQNTVAHRDSSTGFKGVSKEGNKYHAYVNLNGKRYHTRTTTLEDAVEWVRKKREEIHDSEFMRHS